MARTPKILIFDDSALCRAFAGEVLTRAGFEVAPARNLGELDRLLVIWQPDIILTDVRMPELDGATLCQRLKQSLPTTHLPVMLFSILKEAQLEALAAHCGADAYLSKRRGFDPLPAAVTALCEEILW